MDNRVNGNSQIWASSADGREAVGEVGKPKGRLFSETCLSLDALPGLTWLPSTKISLNPLSPSRRQAFCSWGSCWPPKPNSRKEKTPFPPGPVLHPDCGADSAMESPSEIGAGWTPLQGHSSA